jgi:imidazolonepropionase-like amidohydrolase
VRIDGRVVTPTGVVTGSVEVTGARIGEITPGDVADPQWIGTIEVGKVADLILVDGDPLADLGALRKVRQVIQAGVPRPPAGHR